MPRRPGRRRFLRLGTALGSASLIETAAATENTGKTARHRSPSRRQYRAYVDGPYGQIHLTITEPATGRADAPPVVCLPMSPRSGRDFDELALALADRRRVLAPDVPGFGGSDPPPQPVSIDEYAAALLTGLHPLLSSSTRRRPGVDVLGQHTGAAIAIAIARQAPNRVRRIAAIGIPLFEPEERERLRAQFVRPRPYFDDPQFLCTTWARDAAALQTGQPPERMLLRFTEIMRAGTRSHWGFQAVFEHDLRAALKGLTTPLLSIVLNENLAAASRAAAALVQRGEVADLTDLPGSALDFAAPRLAQVARDWFDRA